MTNKLGKHILSAKKHSPTVLFAAGVVGFGTTVFLACRATLKLEEVLDKTETELEKVDETVRVTKNGEDITGDVKRTQRFSIKLNTAIKVARLYTPAVLVGVGTVAALTGSHVIMNRRITGLATAYAILDKTYGDYRKQVIADQGEEKDREYRLGGYKEKEIVQEGPNGPEVLLRKGPDQKALKQAEPSSYARIFDELNPNWSKVPHQNQFFIQSVQNYMNDLLRVRGYVFLNEVYKALGMEESVAGQVVGWTLNRETGDGYIDFGVWRQGVYKGLEWVNGNDQSIWLDFNVDGPILYGGVLEEF